MIQSTLENKNTHSYKHMSWPKRSEKYEPHPCSDQFSRAESYYHVPVSWHCWSLMREVTLYAWPHFCVFRGSPVTPTLWHHFLENSFNRNTTYHGRGMGVRKIVKRTKMRVRIIKQKHRIVSGVSARGES